MTITQAKYFIYRNARPIELTRWQYHFEENTAQNVLTVLDHYQNEDGGFGHALEADSWNPFSSPIQTWAATEILWELNYRDSQHPLIQGILSYLDSGTHQQDELWLNSVPENDHYPHASWWQFANTAQNLNPTAALTGFCLLHASKDSPLYLKADKLAKRISTAFLADETAADAHLLSCLVRLVEYSKAAKYSLPNVKKIKEKLTTAITELIRQDRDKWETQYVARPSDFISSPKSFLYPALQEFVKQECAVIRSSQNKDGAWPIPWSWQSYPEAWPIAKNWWQGELTIRYCRFLAGFSG